MDQRLLPAMEPCNARRTRLLERTGTDHAGPGGALPPGHFTGGGHQVIGGDPARYPGVCRAPHNTPDPIQKTHDDPSVGLCRFPRRHAPRINGRPLLREAVQTT